MDTDAITESLELVAERCGDPIEAVYSLLFARHPDMRELFVRDVNWAVRGQMLHQAVEIAIDHIGARTFSANFISAEAVNHENLGVPPAVFASFFGVMRDAFREVLGDDWTPPFDKAWQELLTQLGSLTGVEAATP